MEARRIHEKYLGLDRAERQQDRLQNATSRLKYA